MAYCWAYPYVKYLVVEVDGRVRRHVDIPVDGRPMMHDFSLTSSYVLLYDLPVVFNPDAATSSSSSSPPYVREPERTPRLGVLRKWLDPDELPAEIALSAITPAGLPAGPHEVRRNEEQDDYDEHTERARRLDVLQRAENEFGPIPFDAEAAGIHGRICAAVISSGRTPRRRVADLMIADDPRFHRHQPRPPLYTERDTNPQVSAVR